MKKLFILLSACVLTPAFAQSICEHPFSKAKLKELNAELPKKTTSDLSINKLTCKGDTIGYEYLMNVSTKTDPQKRRLFAEVMQPKIKEIVCNQPTILSLEQGSIKKIHIKIIDKGRSVLAEDIVPFSSCR